MRLFQTNGLVMFGYACLSHFRPGLQTVICAANVSSDAIQTWFPDSQRMSLFRIARPKRNVTGYQFDIYWIWSILTNILPKTEYFPKIYVTEKWNRKRGRLLLINPVYLLVKLTTKIYNRTQGQTTYGMTFAIIRFRYATGDDKTTILIIHTFPCPETAWQRPYSMSRGSNVVMSSVSVIRKSTSLAKHIHFKHTNILNMVRDFYFFYNPFRRNSKLNALWKCY